MPAGGGGSAACCVHYGPVRAPSNGGVQCCDLPHPAHCGGDGGGGGCGPGGAAARNTAAPPPLYPPRPPPLSGGGAECVARCKPSPCSLYYQGSQSPKSLAGRDPGLYCCGGDGGGGGGCDAQSWWKMNDGGCAGLSWMTQSSEAFPLRWALPLHQHHPGLGSGGDGGGDDGGDPLWNLFSPLTPFVLSVPHLCPDV